MPEPNDWVDIVWYRDFHDVPRLFCVSAPMCVLLFDSPFQSDVDEYASVFKVRRVTGVGAGDPDAVMAAATTTAPIATVTVDAADFDVTRRARFRLPPQLRRADL